MPLKPITTKDVLEEMKRAFDAGIAPFVSLGQMLKATAKGDIQINSPDAGDVIEALAINAEHQFEEALKSLAFRSSKSDEDRPYDYKQRDEVLKIVLDEILSNGCQYEERGDQVRFVGYMSRSVYRQLKKEGKLCRKSEAA
jgi:hypothetical protein